MRVRDPDTLTRVTEYVPKIVSFVECIITNGNGNGYDVDGSLCLDTRAFDEADDHSCMKLEPWNQDNLELLDDDEDVLSVTIGRRFRVYFGLWQASKSGEPSFYRRPWAPGRPGWYIECSRMASAIFGDNLDIHSGGAHPKCAPCPS